MRDILRYPPAGFEDVVRAHFTLVRPLLERQLARWLSECKSPSTLAAMERAYLELIELLDGLDGAGASADGAH